MSVPEHLLDDDIEFLELDDDTEEDCGSCGEPCPYGWVLCRGCSEIERVSRLGDFAMEDQMEKR